MSDPCAQEANIPNSLTAEEVSKAIGEQYASGDIHSVIVQTHYDSVELAVAEVWWNKGSLYLSVRADAPPK